MNSGHFQIAGVAYDFHGCYRTKLMAVKIAKKLVKQGYKVRVTKVDTSEDIFDFFPKKYDVWKRKN